MVSMHNKFKIAGNLVWRNTEKLSSTLKKKAEYKSKLKFLFILYGFVSY